jgi:low affinity Fe/Cu permease
MVSNRSQPANPSGDLAVRKRFTELSDRATYILGSPWSVLTSVALIIAWLLSGPFFHFSDTWQLVINTTTTVITFIMVFVIQASTNRFGKAMMLKMDEILLALPQDRADEAIGAEKLTEDELDAMEERLLAEADVVRARRAARRLRDA